MDYPYAEELRLVNIGRQVLGGEPLTELPKGLPKQSDQCILAHALGYACDGAAMAGIEDHDVAVALAESWDTKVMVHCDDGDDEWEVYLPHPLYVLVSRFDRRELPDLIDQDAEDKSILKSAGEEP